MVSQGQDLGLPISSRLIGSLSRQLTGACEVITSSILVHDGADLALFRLVESGFAGFAVTCCSVPKGHPAVVGNISIIMHQATPQAACRPAKPSLILAACLQELPLLRKALHAAVQDSRASNAAEQLKVRTLLLASGKI